MNRQAMTEAVKPSGNLKQNFEAALVELRHQDDPKAVARHTPIVPRSRLHQGVDPKTRALGVAVTALATLWGV